MILRQIFVVLWAFAVFAFAKNNDGHIHDQMLVLGLWNDSKVSVSKINQSNVWSLLKRFNDGIDEYNGDNQFYNKLKAKYPGFNWGEYGHRIIFHWGYDWGDPLNHKAIDVLCMQKLGDEYACNSLKNDIKLEQEYRESKMTNAVAEFFKTAGLRDFNHAIGAFIYYTHLLGDHIEHAESNDLTNEAVFSTNNIKDRLEVEIRRLTPNKTIAAKCAGEIAKLQKAWDDMRNRGLTGEEEAQAVIDVLKKYLPPILDKAWGNTFKKAGVEIITDSSFLPFF